MTWLTLRGLAGKRLMAPKCTSAQSLACLIFSIVVYVKVLGRAWGTYTMETFHLLYVDRCVAFATHNPWNNESDEWWNITPLKKWIKNMIFLGDPAVRQNIPTLGFCGVFWHAAPLRLHPMRTCPSPDPNWAINTSVRCNISNAVQPNNKVLHKVHFTLYTQECGVVTQREVSLRPSSICSMFLKHWQRRLLPLLSWREFLYVWGLREADQSPGRKHSVQECRAQGHFAWRLC